MKNQKYRNTKKSNQGFSLFTVIVAVSFVGILGFLVLYIALSNFQMKVTDLKAKDSFYTAERALEEVRTGLQEDVGEAMSSAYIKVLETYSKNSDNEGVTNGATLDEIRQAEFKKLFLEELGGRLQKAGDNTQYDIDIINDYLDMEELGVIDSAEETLIVTNPTGKLPVMAKDLSSGIVLRNLKCIYVDQFGRAAIIETDIRLGIPRVQFPTPSTLPDLMNMIVVANSGVICPTGDATKQTVIQGSIYAGLPGGTNENNSIKVEPNAHLSISEGNYVVCQGKIDVADGGSFRNAGPASLWARGIDVTSGEITLIGKTYLADDLTVRSGSGSKVTIEGEYYGYGNPDSALKDGCLNKEMYQGASATDISSAIVINGRNTTMDLSRVSKLMLAGKNYIASSKIPPREGEASNENIMTGESLTVKGTQLAYLVPEELLSANGKPVSNPMSFVDYPSDGVVTDWDKPVEEWGGKTLREIGVDSVQEVFYNDNSSDGYLYFYLNFTDDTRAAAFMQMYYTNNPQVKKKMDKYLGFYFGEDSGIKVNSGQSFLRYITNGNVLAYDGSSQSRSLNSATDTQVGAQSIQEQIKFQNTWYSLNRKMLGSTDLLKTDVKESEGVTHDETLSTRTVFDNLVNETKMVNFITANGVNNEFRHPMPEDEGGLEAVMLNNENGNAFHITSSEAQKLRLLVCTGDVVIEPDVKFQGIIMAKGSITLGSGAQLISSPMEAAKVFQSQITQEYEGKIISPKDFFWEGDKYVLGNALADKEQTGGTKISDFYDLAECVTYENWKKNNRGFTLVEIIIVVAIFTILLGIMAPSLNSILGFRVQRTTGSIAAALDKTKTEAMSRLVGEMELSREEDGYYISYHLDRGKQAADGARMVEDQPEKIAPRNMRVQIQYTDGTPVDLEVGKSLILTYDRSDGSFRPVQNASLEQDEINQFLDVDRTDIVFKDVMNGDKAVFCEKIIVSGGFRTRVITLNQGTGSYTITAG